MSSGSKEIYVLGRFDFYGLGDEFVGRGEGFEACGNDDGIEFFELGFRMLAESAVSVLNFGIEFFISVFDLSTKDFFADVECFFGDEGVFLNGVIFGELYYLFVCELVSSAEMKSDGSRLTQLRHVGRGK